MLWLAFSPSHLAVDALPADLLPQDGTPLAVTARHGSRRWVVAGHGGIFPGADLADVQAVKPELRCIAFRPEAEAEALQQLAILAHGFGSPVHVAHVPPSPELPAGRATVWVGIDRSLRLFGGVDALLAEARQRLADQPLRCRLGVAPTLAGAELAARLEAPTPLTEASALRAWLQDLPLHALALPRNAAEALRASGMHRLGQLLAVPRDQITRRFGATLLRDLDRLLGSAPEARRNHRLPPRFEARQRFDGPIHHVEGLLFPLRRVFGQLALYLRARDTAARSLRLTLAHEDHPATVLQLQLAAPARDAGYWLLLARERLGRLTLPGPVLALAAESSDFASLQAPQLDLFDTARAAEDAWRQSVERLIARLGEAAVWQLASADDHRPERAWQRLPAQAEAAQATATATPGPHRAAQRPPSTAPPAARPQRADPDCDSAACPSPAGSGHHRPLWLLDPPRPLPRPPRLRGRPERIESGWWDGDDTARDYYTAEGENGTRLWVFRRHDDRGWFLHGLWA